MSDRPQNIEIDFTRDFQEESFGRLIHRLGEDLLSTFKEYTKIISPEIENSYIEYKRSHFRRRR